MNNIAKSALRALGRSRGINAAGEIKGLGPSWICDNYAGPDHDYGTCRDCYSNYEKDYLPRLKGATK